MLQCRRVSEQSAPRSDLEQTVTRIKQKKKTVTNVEQNTALTANAEPNATSAANDGQNPVSAETTSSKTQQRLKEVSKTHQAFAVRSEDPGFERENWCKPLLFEFCCNTTIIT